MKPEDFPKPGEIEQRSADNAELKVEGNVLHGVIPYGSKSKPIGGKWVETIQPGAFANTDMENLVLTVNHDHTGIPLGRFNSTLKVEDRADGLSWSCELPSSPMGQDVKAAIERSDLQASSWRMVVEPSGDKRDWRANTRTITAVKCLEDVSLVTKPAYPDALVELREDATDPTPPVSEEPVNDNSPEKEPMKEDEKTSGPSLRVEDRSAETAAGANVEERILGAMAEVPKGECRSLTHSSAQPVEPPELATSLWDKFRDQAVFLRAGAPIITTSRQKITWPTLTGDVTVGFYKELEKITASDPAFSELTVEPSAIKGLVRGSSEAFEDSDPDLLSIVQKSLVDSMSLKFDAEAISGGTSGGFSGLLKLSGTQSLDMAKKGFSDFDPFVAAIGLLASANVPGPFAVIMNPLVQTSIARIKESHDEKASNLLLPAPEGLPPIFTSNLVPIKAASGEDPALSSVIVYAPAQFPVVRRKDATVEVDRSEEFDSDAVLVRGKARATIAAPHANAAVIIKNVKTPAITL